MSKETNNFNVPNVLSTFRLLLVPIFVYLYFHGDRSGHLWAGGVFLLAAATDVLDGRIARKYDLVTPLGRILDPMADKLMQCTAWVCLAIARIIPLWIAIGYVIKELLMTIGGFLMLRRYSDVFPSNYFGKGVSFCVFALAAFLILFPDVFPDGAPWLAGILLLFSLAALAVYVIRYMRTSAHRDDRPEDGQQS